MESPFQELVNFRDLGGKPSRFGGMVTPRTVFRAGLFSFVGSDASSHLVNELGVATVIDLRMDEELAEHPPPPMYAQHPDLKPVHLPFFRREDLAGTSIPRGYDLESWSSRYASNTELAGRHTAVRVYEELLADDTAPTVFHCWSGKDRTGLTAAMLLDLLGVDDNAIGADYQQSMDWWLARLAIEELGEDEPPESYHTTSEVILLALNKLRHRFGNIVEMLLQSGMEHDLPDRLRSALLT